MRVLVSGTRNGSVKIEKRVFKELDKLQGRYGTTLHLILGDARGVDQYAKNWAELRKVNHSIHYARWEEQGKAAGTLRNLVMFSEAPDFVLTFPSKESKGTRYVINYAKTHKISSKVVEV